MILPYQEGDSICDTEASTEVLSNSDSVETGINYKTLHTREVFMVRRPRSLLVPPERPTSGHQMNPNPIYHPSPRGMIVKLKAETNQREEEQEEARTSTPCLGALGSLGHI
jgi:hypothetical protein